MFPDGGQEWILNVYQRIRSFYRQKQFHGEEYGRGRNEIRMEVMTIPVGGRWYVSCFCGR